MMSKLIKLNIVMLLVHILSFILNICVGNILWGINSLIWIITHTYIVVKFR